MFDSFNEAAGKTGGKTMNEKDMKRALDEMCQADDAERAAAERHAVAKYSFCDCHKLLEARRPSDGLFVRYEQWGVYTFFTVEITLAVGDGAWLPKAATVSGRSEGSRAEWRDN